VFGTAAFPLGVALAAVEMRQPALARAVPIAVRVIVLIAGSLQFTARKGASPRLLPGGTRARPDVTANTSRYVRPPTASAHNTTLFWGATGGWEPSDRRGHLIDGLHPMASPT
jgi:hypothetical protein